MGTANLDKDSAGGQKEALLEANITIGGRRVVRWRWAGALDRGPLRGVFLLMQVSMRFQ